MSFKGQSQVMVVDDHQGVCEMVATLVENLGHQPHLATDGETAIEMLGVGGFDLLVTDLKLPDMDGLEILRRSKEAAPLVPVILLTGYPTVDAAIQAIKAGASDFLTKPFRMEQLEWAICRALEERRLVEENQRLAAEANKVAVIQRLNTKLNQKVRELLNLNRISEAINAAEENSDLFEKVVDLATELTGAQRVSLMLMAPDGETLTIRAARGMNQLVIREAKVGLGSGIAGQVALSKTPLHVVRSAPMPQGLDTRSVYQSPSFICVPLMISGEVLGVLNIAEKPGAGDFTAEDFSLAEALAQKAAINIENNALYESIYGNLVDTLTSLVSTLEAKDPYTKEHSKRVTHVAVALGRRLGLPELDIESIQFAGILHDIGKIGVRDSILLKPGRLTVAEFEVIKMHPVIGETIVEPLGLIQSERHIIRHHHERLDGSGYPDGLEGEDIPLLARIVAVADAFDAMTTTRIYRPAMGLTYALSEFERLRGIHYDSGIVDALHQILDEESESIVPARSGARRVAR
jgi:putative nucleotidyltransferase with HDIG domain